MNRSSENKDIKTKHLKEKKSKLTKDFKNKRPKGKKS